MAQRITDAVAARSAAPTTASDFDSGELVFRAATKDKAKVRLALQGVSGSGKTWTGLTTSAALAVVEETRLAVIDTERGAASKYAGVNGLSFDVLQMSRYDPRDLVKALAAAASAGYGVAMVDSLSHFWKGADGTLEQVNKAAKNDFGGNTFGGWMKGTPMQNDMVDALLSFPGHLVVTMRSHTEWVLQENSRGKKEPVAVGTRADQRRGMEYEFDVVGAMDVENTLRILKSRCPSLHRQVIELPDGTVLAKQLLDWLNDGAAGVDATAFIKRATAEGATYEDMLALHREADSHGLLATPMLDPADRKPTSLGEYVRARGSQLNTGGAQ